MDIKSLLGGKAPNQTVAAKPLVQKWQRTGLLEGLKSETEMAGMAQLLENQARQLVKEASATGTAEGSEEWAGVALPLGKKNFC
jgi:hypothetical protein